MISLVKDVQYKLFAFVRAQFIIIRDKTPNPSKAADGMKMEESGNTRKEEHLFTTASYIRAKRGITRRLLFWPFSKGKNKE